MIQYTVIFTNGDRAFVFANDDRAAQRVASVAAAQTGRTVRRVRCS